MPRAAPETHEYCPSCDNNIFVYPAGLPDRDEDATTPQGERLVLCMSCLSLLIQDKADTLRFCTEVEWHGLPTDLQEALMDQALLVDKFRRTLHLFHDIIQPVPDVDEVGIPDLPERPVVPFIH